MTPSPGPSKGFHFLMITLRFLMPFAQPPAVNSKTHSGHTFSESSRSMIHCNGIQGSNEREAQDFFDAIDALNLAEVPSAAGQKYFGRFVRWALREFLADAQGTVSQARSIPGEGSRHIEC